MKALEIFAAKHNLQVVPIRYKHGFGYCKRKGYDLVNPITKEILVSFEPCQFRTIKNKWYLRNVHANYNGARYITRITSKFLNDNINPEETSFFRLS